MNKKILIYPALFASAGVLLAGCGANKDRQDETLATSAAVDTITPSPPGTEKEETTEAPTATPIPTSTPKPTPTNTPSPTPEPTQPPEETYETEIANTITNESTSSSAIQDLTDLCRRKIILTAQSGSAAAAEIMIS